MNSYYEYIKKHVLGSRLLYIRKSNCSLHKPVLKIIYSDVQKSIIAN